MLFIKLETLKIAFIILKLHLSQSQVKKNQQKTIKNFAGIWTVSTGVLKENETYSFP